MSYLQQKKNNKTVISAPGTFKKQEKGEHQIFLAFFTPSADYDQTQWGATLGYYINATTAWWTSSRDEMHKNKRFSHVELILPTTGESYSIRWGEEIHAEKRSYMPSTTNNSSTIAPECYGFINFAFLTKKEYDDVVLYCNHALQNQLKFNYIGNLVNFLLPISVLNYLFPKKGYYYDRNRVFCTEFILNTLQQAVILDKDLEHKPGLISPNGLWELIYTLVLENKLDMSTVGSTNIYRINEEIQKCKEKEDINDECAIDF